jgi:ankyrin repeat protein
VDARLTFSRPRKPSATDDFTALRFAIEAKNAQAVKVLIAYKADVNADWRGWAPLHHAASAGHLEIVKLLVAAGARVDAKTAAVPERWSGPAPSGPAERAAVQTGAAARDFVVLGTRPGEGREARGGGRVP